MWRFLEQQNKPFFEVYNKRIEQKRKIAITETNSQTLLQHKTDQAHPAATESDSSIRHLPRIFAVPTTPARVLIRESPRSRSYKSSPLSAQLPR